VKTTIKPQLLNHIFTYGRLL